MLMAYIWTGMLAASIACASVSGNLQELSPALLLGAGKAAELCISIAGAVCLWTGIMELMKRSGMSRALSRLLAPLLRLVFPICFRDAECAEALSENFSANLLGLGNAATPAGIRAAKRMLALQGESGNEMSRLVVMNTASLQLLPTTVAAVRAAYGTRDAFDILPCVWIASVCSVAVGLICAWLLEKKKP